MVVGVKNSRSLDRTIRISVSSSPARLWQPERLHSNWTNNTSVPPRKPRSASLFVQALTADAQLRCGCFGGRRRCPLRWRSQRFDRRGNSEYFGISESLLRHVRKSITSDLENLSQPLASRAQELEKRFSFWCKMTVRHRRRDAVLDIFVWFLVKSSQSCASSMKIARTSKRLMFFFHSTQHRTQNRTQKKNHHQSCS